MDALECRECQMKFDSPEKLSNHKLKFCVTSDYADPERLRRKIREEERVTPASYDFGMVQNYLKASDPATTDPLIGKQTLAELRTHVRSNANDLDALHRTLVTTQQTKQVDELRQLKVEQARIRAEREAEEAQLLEKLRELEDIKAAEMRDRMERERARRELEGLDKRRLQEVEAEKTDQLAKLELERRALEMREQALRDEMSTLEARITTHNAHDAETERLMSMILGRPTVAAADAAAAANLAGAAAQGDKLTPQQRLESVQRQRAMARGAQSAEAQARAAELLAERKRIDSRLVGLAAEVSARPYSASGRARDSRDAAPGSNAEYRDAKLAARAPAAAAGVAALPAPTGDDLADLKALVKHLEAGDAVMADRTRKLVASHQRELEHDREVAMGADAFARAMRAAGDAHGSMDEAEQLNMAHLDADDALKEVLERERRRARDLEARLADKDRERELEVQRARDEDRVRQAAVQREHAAEMERLRAERDGGPLAPPSPAPPRAETPRVRSSTRAARGRHGSSDDENDDDGALHGRKSRVGAARSDVSPGASPLPARPTAAATALDDELAVLRRAYLESGGANPDILAAIVELEREAAAVRALAQLPSAQAPPQAWAPNSAAAYFGLPAQLPGHPVAHAQPYGVAAGAAAAPYGVYRDAATEALFRQETENRALYDELQTLLREDESRRSAAWAKDLEVKMARIAKQVGRLGARAGTSDVGVTSADLDALLAQMPADDPDVSAMRKAHLTDMMALEMEKARTRNLIELQKLKQTQDELAVRGGGAAGGGAPRGGQRFDPFAPATRAPYDSLTGLCVLFDLVAGLPPTAVGEVHLSYAFFVRDSAKTGVRSIPPVVAEQDEFVFVGSGARVASILARKRFQKVPFQLHLRLVVEIQHVVNVPPEQQHAPDAASMLVESIGWTFVDVFSRFATPSGRPQLNSGAFRLPLLCPPVTLTALGQAAAALPYVQGPELFLRILEPAYADDPASGLADPATLLDQYVVTEPAAGVSVEARADPTDAAVLAADAYDALPTARGLPSQFVHTGPEYGLYGAGVGAGVPAGYASMAGGPVGAGGGGVGGGGGGGVGVGGGAGGGGGGGYGVAAGVDVGHPAARLGAGSSAAMGVESMPPARRVRTRLAFGIEIIDALALPPSEVPLRVEITVRRLDEDVRDNETRASSQRSRLAARGSAAAMSGFLPDGSEIFVSTAREMTGILGSLAWGEKHAFAATRASAAKLAVLRLIKTEGAIESTLAWAYVPLFKTNADGAHLVAEGTHALALYRAPIAFPPEAGSEIADALLNVRVYDPLSLAEQLEHEDIAGVPRKAWMRIENLLPDRSDANLFRAGDSFEVFIDGARFLPDNVTVTRVFGLVLGSSFAPVCDAAVVASALPDSSVLSPVYAASAIFAADKVDPTATLLIMLTTYDPVVGGTVTVGYAALNVFITADASSSLDQPQNASTVDFVLNEGAFQLPLAMGGPAVDAGVLTVHSLDANRRVPCATVLVRLAKPRRDALGKTLRAEDLDVAAAQALAARPRFVDGVYDSRRCVPEGVDIKLYRARARRAEQSVQTGRELLLSLGFRGDLKDEVAVLEFIVAKLARDESEPERFLDYTFLAKYVPEMGFRVAVDGASNLPKAPSSGLSGFTSAVLVLAPPAALYGEPRLTSGVEITTQRDWNESQRSPVFTDGYKLFKSILPTENMCVIVELYGVGLAKKKAGALVPAGWAVLPLFTPNAEYIQSGAFMLPVLKGRPTVDLLRRICATEPPYEVLRAMLARKEIALEDNCSVLVRLVDDQRDDELREARDHQLQPYLTALARRPDKYLKPVEAKPLRAIVPKGQSVVEFEAHANQTFVDAMGIVHFSFR